MTIVTPSERASHEALVPDLLRAMSENLAEGADPQAAADRLAAWGASFPGMLVSAFVQCPCGNYTDTPTRLSACCSIECEETEIIARQVEDMVFWSEVSLTLSAPEEEPSETPEVTPGQRHTLRYEGAPFDENGYRVGHMGVGGTGRGKCSCGEFSDVLHSGSQRKAWHREHKALVTH